MRNLNRQEAEPTVLKNLMTLLIGLSFLTAAGCSSERDANDGTVFNSIVLPTDVVLNLACADVGIAGETCVLDDPENPYASTTITEFSVDDPGNKFDLFNAIPPGPTGAKARFYFWATALARRQSGENQFYTALALHELFDANSNVQAEFTDELIRAQALKAYRSVLDNFFSSVTVFSCCPGASPDGEPVQFAVPLNELTADILFRTDATGFLRLVEGDPILVLELFVDWGYTYQPANPPNYDDGVVGVAVF